LVVFSHQFNTDGSSSSSDLVLSVKQ